VAGITKTQVRGVQSSGTSVGLSFLSTPAVGSLIIVGHASVNGGAVTFSDNQGNTYATIVTASPSGKARVAWAKATTSAGTFTVTCATGGAQDHSFAICEAAGQHATTPVDDADGAAADTGTTSTPSSGNLAATGAADGLLVGIFCNGDVTTTLTAKAAWTDEAEVEADTNTPFSFISRGFGGGLAAATVDAAGWVLGASRADGAAAAASFAPAAGGDANVFQDNAFQDNAFQTDAAAGAVPPWQGRRARWWRSRWVK
jgi:hypothetical protein